MPNTAPSKSAGSKRLHIAVGVLEAADGKVLISQRRQGTQGAGLWEYPGGKCEPGESVKDALTRELCEELGIEISQARPLIRIRHQYPDRHVLLDTWRVTAWRGEARGLEGQTLSWVRPASLGQWQLLPANAPITRAVTLPDCYLITPEPGADRSLFLTRLEQALATGIKLLRLRAPRLGDSDYLELARACQLRCAKAGAGLMIDRALALEGVTGLHLTSSHLMRCSERPSVTGLLAASCHSSRELEKAQQMGCDFAVLGPVLPTVSHPGNTTLGWASAGALIDMANMPIYCLGGMRKPDVGRCYELGAQGIAAIRGLWPGES